MEAEALRTDDPERLGEYVLEGRLGHGGQGAVFLGVAEDGRRVAVKLLHAELTADERARARFLRELEVAKRVAGFCTAQVLDADVAGDRPYIVSEYVPGPSLAVRVAEQGPLSGAALERLAIGTATALVSIHQAGIVHRDLKPHNVLIGPDGPRVIDFGVARAISGASTVTSQIIGTPAYMAPEQLKGADAGTAADVFCWAATIAFAATGRPPFGQDNIPAVINRILNAEPDLGDLTGPLVDLVDACLAKDPADRPEAGGLLMRLLGHDDPAAAAPGAAAGDDADPTALLAVASELAADLDDDATRVDRPARRRPTPTPPPPPPEERPEPVTESGPRPTGTFPAVGGGKLPTPHEWAEQNGLGTMSTQDVARAQARSAGRGGVPRPGRPAVLAVAGALLLVVLATVAFALGGGGGQGEGQNVGGPDDVGTEHVDDGPEKRYDPPPDDGPPDPAPSTTVRPEPTKSAPPDPDPEPQPTDPSTGPTDPPSDPPDPSPSSPPPDPGTPPPDPSGTPPETEQ
ncbi:serine/threonine-protein kinase [Thermomonospora umbrina]|uniref:Serine/threonine protein kinase n=1 Tax=Thermomonospora umbrina TaxID=111806 RepID=A0A3D9SWT0_9ACTN|nr:serine/threonine-protein kinase [Thermomonospora umbrina]REE98493.1 serine/threonine protein kinase [Thermomonospora umbrina]